MGDGSNFLNFLNFPGPRNAGKVAAGRCARPVRVTARDPLRYSRYGRCTVPSRSRTGGQAPLSGCQCGRLHTVDLRSLAETVPWLLSLLSTQPVEKCPTNRV